MKIVLDFDDLHWSNPVNCLDSIDYLISSNPKIKLTFFTIPYYNNNPIGADKDFCKRIKEYIDSNNIVLAIHGTTHSVLEYLEKSYEDAINSISLSEFYMTEAGLPFIKVFKGPHWGINKETINALIQHNYKEIFNHESFRHLEVPEIKFTYYNWNLKDNFTPSKIIYAHGHTHDVCENGIRETRDKILDAIRTNNLECIFPHESILYNT